MLLLSVLLSFAAAVWAAALLKPGSHIIELDKKNFNDIVLDPSKHTVVQFYALWCSHCKHMTPALEELADFFHDHSSRVQVARVDADRYSRIGKRFNIEAYPDVVLFRNGGGLEGGKVKPKHSQDIITYEGLRSFDSMRDFVRLHTRVYVPEGELRVLMLDDSNLEGSLTTPTLVAFTRGCSDCRVLKDPYQRLAYVFDRDPVAIAQVDTADKLRSSARVVEQYGVSDFPTLLFFDGHGGAPVPYTGARDIESLVAFVNTACGLHRDVDGHLLPSAGRLPAVDEQVWVAMQGGVWDPVVAAAEGFGDTASYYRRCAERSQEDPKWAAAELERLQRILRGNVGGVQRDQLTAKINVLRAFTGKPV